MRQGDRGGRGATGSTFQYVRPQPRTAKPPAAGIMVAPVFALESFERRLFAGANLSPDGAVANPAAAQLGGAVAQAAASIEGPWLGRGGRQGAVPAAAAGGRVANPFATAGTRPTRPAGSGGGGGGGAAWPQRADAVPPHLPQASWLLQGGLSSSSLSSALQADGLGGSGGAAPKAAAGASPAPGTASGSGTAPGGGAASGSGGATAAAVATTYNPVAELDNIDRFRTAGLSAITPPDGSSGGGGGGLVSAQSGSATPMASMAEAADSRVLGIDVSQFQGTINWASVHDAGKEFAFIRATKGNATLDTQFAANTAGAWANGVLAGVYHTAQPDATAGDAVAEANYFLANARPYMGPGWMRPVLSIEAGSGLGATALSQWASDFSNVVFTATGVRPLVFTNSNYAKNYLNTSVATHDLWLSRWNTGTVDPEADQPQTPAGYPNPYGVWNDPVGSTTPSHSSWDFWQYTSLGAVAGVDPAVNTVDLDVFQGTRAELESRFVIPAAAPAFQLGINFAPYEADVTPGYVNVADQTFGSVQGYQMGWNAAGTVMYAHNSVNAPDQRYQTYAMPNDYNGASRSFEVAVPNGTYRVRVVAGSPDNVGNTHKFWAEGVAVVNGVSNSVSRFLTGVVTVSVTDGRLTISSDSASAPYSRLAFLDVVRADRAATLPVAPSAVTAVPASPTSVDVRWQDNADNEGRDPGSFSSATWGQVNEGYRVERRAWTGTAWGSWSVRGYARAGAEVYQDTGLTAGQKYQYRVSAVNNLGQSPVVPGAAMTTPATNAQAAYNATGTPWAVPGTVEAEDFDRGGQGVGFNDTSAGNAGGYYRGGAVDVGRVWSTDGSGAPTTPRQHYVGWQRASEWTAYTVNVPAAGAYLLSFRLANPGTGRKFHASVVRDGVETNLAAAAPGGQWDVPQTAGLDAYTTVVQRVTLPAGVQTIRVYADAAPAGNTTVMNLDRFSVDYAERATVYGAAEVDMGRLYALTLPTTMESGVTITGWTIDWGDGTDPDGDGVVGESVHGNPTNANHVYVSDPGDYAVVATARYNVGQYVCSPLTVTVRPALVLAGPEVATAGDYLTYTVARPPGWDDEPVWTVTVGGAPYATGRGGTLSFVPDRAGSYVVEALTLKGGASLSASTTVAVSSAATGVSISGPPILFVGRPGVFSSTVSGAGVGSGPLTYAWSIGQADGAPQTKLGVYRSTGDLPSFVVPAGLEPGAYTAVLTVTDGQGVPVTRKSKFHVLADPSEADYDKGFVPVDLDQAAVTVDIPLAIARQADGRILVAGQAREMAGIAPGTDAAFVARFNSDLTIDTTFGRGGVVVNALGGLPGQYARSTAMVLAVDPTTQDIVVSGTVAKASSDSKPGLAVARYRPDGTADPGFHGGTPWTRLPPSWGSWSTDDANWDPPAATPPLDWSATPSDLVVLRDGSILIGGSRTQYWGDGTYMNWTYHQDDFMLLRLTGAGTPDAAFGDGGFARTVNPMRLLPEVTWDALGGANPVGVPGGFSRWETTNGGWNNVTSARIEKVVPQFDGDGKLTTILVGGTALDWANSDNVEANGLEYTGSGMDFVLARYDEEGNVDTTFGPGGKVVTDFGTVEHYHNGFTSYWHNDYLSNLRILPGGGILAVGSAPSRTLAGNTRDGNGIDAIDVPPVLAMAWYTANGEPDHTIGMSDGPSHHTGTFVSSIIVGAAGNGGVLSVGGNKRFESVDQLITGIPDRHQGSAAITFQPSDGKIVVSTQDFGSWGGGSYHFAFAGSGWSMIRVLTDDALYSGGDVVAEMDVRDRTFGSLGDGAVVFSSPDPVLVVRPPGTVVDGGTIGRPTYGTAAILATEEDGVLAVGGIKLGNWNDAKYHNPSDLPNDQGSTSMVVRYKAVNATPANLAATGTGPQSVLLTWDAPAEGTWYGYMIERARAAGGGAPGPYKVIGYAGQGDKSYSDADPALEPGTTYFYRIHAIDGRFNPNDPSATAVPTFAGPAQASTLPDLSNYGLVETITLDPNGTVVRSGTTLVSGVKYILRAAGSFYALGPDGHQYQLDAEYVLANNLWRDTQTTAGGGTVDVGVALNGPGRVQFYKDAYSVDEAAATYEATFTVVRTGGLVGDLSFHYKTVDGTGDDAAIDGTDYDAVCGDVTLPDGVSTAAIRVPIRHNPASGDRRFTLELTDVAHPGGPARASATVKIGDTDAAPTFDVAVDRQRLPAGQAVTVTVTRHGNGHGAQTVHVATGGGTAVSTAEPGHAADGDYDGLDLDVPFAANGSAVWRRTIVTYDRGPAHAGRFFDVTLTAGSGTGGAVLARTSVTLTDAADAPTLGLDRPAYAFGEADGPVAIELTLSTGLARSLTVPYTISGAAVAGADYTVPGSLVVPSGAGHTVTGSVVIPAGQTRWPVPLHILNDKAYEGDETFTMVLGTPTGGVVAAETGSTVVTIVDDDAAAVLQWGAWDPSNRMAADADGTLRLYVHRTGNTTGRTKVHVNVVGDSAYPGTNFTGGTGDYTFDDGQEYLPIDVTIVYEGFAGTKGFDLVLTDPSPDAVLNPEPGATDARIEIFGTGVSSPATTQTFTIVSYPYAFGEGAGTARLWVMRDGPNLSQSADVSYSTMPATTAHAAVAGVDFEPPPSGAAAHFAPNARFAPIDVTLIPNPIPDGTRTFRVELTGSGDGDVDPTPAQVAILDDDAAAVVGFEVVYDSGSHLSNPVSEGYGVYKLYVRRTGNTAGPSDVTYAVTGATATAGVDYSVTTPGTVHFEPGEEEKWIEVTILDDEVADGPKYIDFALTGASGGTVFGADRTVRVNILDDEGKPAAVVSLSSTSYEVAEGDDAWLTVNRTGDTSHAVTVHWTTSPGTARPLDDYGYNPRNASALSGTVTIPAGKATALIRIPTAADGRREGDETFFVTLTGAAVTDGSTSTTAVVRGIARASATITEPALISIDRIEYSTPLPSPASYPYPRAGVNNVGSKPNVAVVTLRRDGTAAEIGMFASVDWSVLDPDGKMWTGTAYFKPGATKATVTIVAPVEHLSTSPSMGPANNPTIDGFAGVFPYPVALELTNSVNASLGVPSFVNVTVWGFQANYFSYGFPGEHPSSVESGSYARTMAAPLLASDSQSVRFGSKVYVINEGAGEVELEVMRLGGTEGTLTVHYVTSEAGVTAIAGADYDAVTDGVLTFEPGEETKTIRIRIRPDLVAGETMGGAAEADETFGVTLTGVTASDGGAASVSDEFGSATVVIASLTDPAKRPIWGDPSTASDHGYETVVTGDGQPLYLNYRAGAFTGFTTDTDGVKVQIYAPLPGAVTQLAAVQDWGTKSIKLAWKLPRDVGSADYYVIERSENGGDFEVLDTVAVGVTSYVDSTHVGGTHVDQGKVYSYRITAHGGGLDSHPSNIAYAMLINRAPKVQDIGTQLVHPGDTGFEYGVVASDAEDGKNLTYSRDVVDGNNAPANYVLNIDPCTGVITQGSGWIPSTADVGKVYTVTIHVADKSGDPPTDRTFSLAVVETPPLLPRVGTITATVSADGRSATLDGGAEAGMIYQWQVLPAAAGEPVATIADPTVRNPTINFTKAGPYQYRVRLRVSRPDNLAASATVVGSINVEQRTAGIVVSPMPADYDYDADPDHLFSPTLPGGSPPVVVGTSRQDFVATAYDQFGNIMDGDGPNGAHPSLNWFLYGVSGVQAKLGGAVEVGDKFTLTLTYPDPEIAGSFATKDITVSATAGTAANVVALLVKKWNEDAELAAYATASAGKDTVILAAANNVKTLAVTASATEFNGAPADGQTFTVTTTAAASAGTPIASQSGTKSVWFSADAYRTGLFRLVASTSGSNVPTALHGSITISFTDLTLPEEISISHSEDGTTSTLHASVTGYPGAIDDLIYTWSSAQAEVTFSDNGTTTAKDAVAYFHKARAYQLYLTVTDPHNFVSRTYEVDPISFTSTLTALRVIPGRPTVTAGGFVKLTAAAVDQFGTVVDDLLSSDVTWEFDGPGTLTYPDNAGGSPNGPKARYGAPSSAPSGPSSLLGTLHVTTQLGTSALDAYVPINFGVQTPPTVSLKVDTVADPLTEDTGHAANLVDRPQAVKAIISDPSGGTLTWSLTATPQGQNGEGTVLLSGTGAAGALPGIFARIGTIAPTQLPDGIYTLTLRVRSQYDESSFVTASASQVVQVRSAVKLGNLTLPVTDLTQDVPNAAPITVSRGYDSQRAGQDVGLGYGWTLDALTPALVSTQTVQYGDQKNPISGTGTPGTSLAMNDLIYVTLPSGEEHVFAFRPMPMLDTSKLGAGLVLGVATYLPHFVPVDGSITTLQPCNSSGEPRTDEDTLYWDSFNGYMFKSADNNMGYNPGLKNEFGGYYLMTTVDGMRYVVNAATGRLHSRIDLQGRTQTFNENGATSTTVGARTYEAVPTDWNYDTGHITRIITQVREGASTTPLQEALYGYDGLGDLTSVVVKDIATGAVLRSTQYTYDSFHHLTGVTDGLGVTVLSADYDPVNGQLARLTNTRDTAAKSSTEYSGDHASQTVTDPAGNQVFNEYDDHGNVVRSITTVTDASGKVPLYYVVTVSDYGYGDPVGTDDGRGPDGSERLVHGKYVDYWPKVNVVEHAYTSTPFVVPTARAGDRFLGIDALKARGYLKTDAAGPNQIGNVLWASMQEYDPETRVLTSTRTLKGDGAYLTTVYNLGADHRPTYVFGKPTQVHTRIEQGSNVRDLTSTFAFYDPGTGLLTSSKGSDGQMTNYVYGGDPLPRSGGFDGGESAPPHVDAPVGSLYGLYRESIYDDVTESSTPLWLTVNGYYGYDDNDSFTPATATTPGGVAGLLAFTTDFSADPRFGLPADPTHPVVGVTTRFTYWPDGRVADVYKEWQQPDGSTWYKVLQSHTEYDALGRVTKVYTQPDQVTDIPVGDQGRHWTVSDLAGPASPHTTTTYDANGQVLDTVDVYGGVTHRVYDASGHLVQTLYPDQTETRTVYDAQGRVTWQTDRFAPTPVSTYNPATGEVGSHPSATANATRTIYDHQGRAIATERHANVQISMATDPATPAGSTAHIYTSLLASPGTVVSTNSTVYDALGRVVQTTDAAGLRTGTIYYPDGRVRYTGVLLDGVSDKGTSPWYATLPADESMWLVKFQWTNQVSGFSTGETVTQAVTGAKATLTSADGTYLYLSYVSGTWDASHPVTGERSGATADAGGSTTGPLNGLFASCTSYAYDQLYDPTYLRPPGSPVPPPGAAFVGGWATHDPATDALGRTTWAYRDAAGRPRGTLYADGSYEATYLSYPYNPDHLPAPPPDDWVDAPGKLWAISYDEGWTWRQDTDDPNSDMKLPAGWSEVVKVAQRKRNSNDPALATVYVYDPAGRLTDVWLPYVADGNPDSPTYGDKVRPHWRYTYDANGNQLTQTDPNGHTTTFAYDEQGRRVGRTLPDGQAEHDSYDAYGRPLTHVDFKGQTTAYEYDALGRLSKEWRFYAGVTALNTDKSIRTSAAAEHTEYRYDNLGRQDQVREYHGSNTTPVRTETSTFDPVTGQLASKATPEGTVHYEYDPATGRHIETWVGTIKANGGADTLYGYDKQGRLASVSIARVNGGAPSPVQATVRYDAAGNAVSTTLRTTLYTYDAVGNLQSTSLPNGLTTTYSYDDLNRLTLERVTRDDLSTPSVETDPVVTFDYNYLDTSAPTTAEQRRFMIQNDGQRGGVVETRYGPTGSVFSRTAIDYEYDADGRLTREIRAVGVAGAPIPSGDQAFTDTYAYDLNGNRLTKTHNIGSNGTIEQTTRSVYGEIDSSDTLITPSGNDHLRWTITTDASGTGTARTEYRYDANGSTVFTQTTTGGVAGDVHETFYDLRNRMVTADISDGAGTYSSSTSYTYDSSGRLVGRGVNDVAGGEFLHTSTYLVDEVNPTGYSQVLWELHTDDDIPDPQESTWASTSFYGLGIVAQVAPGGLTYFVTDGHGSTRALTNYQGQVTATQDYDAFGNALNFAPTDAPARPFYAGQVFDGVLGQYYMRARYYNQTVGRFSAQDSLTFGPGGYRNANLYVYVGGNPINGIDPSGHVEMALGGGALLGQALLSIGVGVLALGPYAAGVAATGLGLYGAVKGIQAIRPYLDALWTSGVSNADAIAEYATDHLSSVGAAIDTAENEASAATGISKQVLQTYPIWPVWGRFTPTIYANTVAYLASVPKHYVLTFNGLLSPQTVFNRIWVKGIYGGVVNATSRAAGLNSLDEYPYASTAEGGPAGPAVGWPVPLQENLVQGGMLLAFYVCVMGSRPGPFLVVPIP